MKNHRIAAARAQARLAAGEYGVEVPTDAASALDLCLGLSHGRVRALAARLERAREAIDSDGRDHVADVLRRRDVELRGGNVDGLLPFEQLNGPEQKRWRALAAAALEAADAALSRDDVAALSSAMDAALRDFAASAKLNADLNTDERRTRVLERQAEQLAGAVNAAMGELIAAGLPDKFRTLAGDAFSRHLRALDDPGVVEGQIVVLAGERP